MWYLKKSKHKGPGRSAIMKSGTSQPSDFMDRIVSETVGEDAITALAYQLWQERGCPVGSDQQDWFQAEQDLKGSKVSVPTTA